LPFIEASLKLLHGVCWSFLNLVFFYNIICCTFADIWNKIYVGKYYTVNQKSEVWG